MAVQSSRTCALTATYTSKTRPGIRPTNSQGTQNAIAPSLALLFRRGAGGRAYSDFTLCSLPLPFRLALGAAAFPGPEASSASLYMLFLAASGSARAASDSASAFARLLRFLLLERLGELSTARLNIKPPPGPRCRRHPVALEPFSKGLDVGDLMDSLLARGLAIEPIRWVQRNDVDDSTNLLLPPSTQGAKQPLRAVVKERSRRLSRITRADTLPCCWRKGSLLCGPRPRRWVRCWRPCAVRRPPFAHRTCRTSSREHPRRAR